MRLPAERSGSERGLVEVRHSRSRSSRRAAANEFVEKTHDRQPFG